ncbi:P-loop containing nucleoside triphosphate hydrolase protein, partial [Mycena olivaceomarginata]
VLSSTRELATQIQSVLLPSGDFMHVCIGGRLLARTSPSSSMGSASCTPGRVFNMIRHEMLVLDEVKELLNKGFKDQIYDIYCYLPPTTQVVLLSATLPYDVLEMTTKFMTDPIRILV